MFKVNNPMLRGFNSDPSIIPVEDDYYIATSKIIPFFEAVFYLLRIQTRAVQWYNMMNYKGIVIYSMLVVCRLYRMDGFLLFYWKDIRDAIQQIV